MCWLLLFNIRQMAPLNKMNYKNSCEYGMLGIHLPWCVQKNDLLIFSSFLDIWENVEWPRFWTTL